MADIKIDFKKTTGRFKAVHGVNNGPVCYGSLVDVSRYYKELGIPYVRVHDTNWPHPREVDIYAVFPDWDKDPCDPESYDFRSTDEYINSIIHLGAEIVYRLGVSIEHTKEKFHTSPPKDFEKWAKICVGVIKHYNQGWANGFNHGIKYWEVWNEPDNPDGSCMWSGTPEQYFELYKVVSTSIKKLDPELKVGGFAATMANLGFTRSFLEYCKNNRLFLDFFSWHTYTNDPELIVSNAKMVESLLQEYGFDSAERHFNEWNYACKDPEIKAVFRAGNEYDTEKFFERSKGMEGASFDAAVLILLQDCPVEIANFYDAAPTSYWSLFNFYGVPQKNYYAFKAFKLLYDNPKRVETEVLSELKGLYCCCGMDDGRNEATLLISNFSEEGRDLTIKLDHLYFSSPHVCQTYLLDNTRNLELVSNEEICTNDEINKYVGRHTVALLKII